MEFWATSARAACAHCLSEHKHGMSSVDINLFQGDRWASSSFSSQVSKARQICTFSRKWAAFRKMYAKSLSLPVSRARFSNFSRSRGSSGSTCSSLTIGHNSTSVNLAVVRLPAAYLYTATFSWMASQDRAPLMASSNGGCDLPCRHHRRGSLSRAVKGFFFDGGHK